MALEHAIFSENQTTSDEVGQLIALIERIDRLAATTPATSLVAAMVELLVDEAGAVAGQLLLDDPISRTLTTFCSVGTVAAQVEADAIRNALADQQPLRLPGELDVAGASSSQVLVIPLPGNDRAHGAVVLWGSSAPRRVMLEMIVRRLAVEVDRMHSARLGERRDDRLRMLLEVRERIGSTLDRDQILDLIIDYARRLLKSEASSLFMVDAKSNEIVLHNASGSNKGNLGHVRIPAGKGIIGHVIDSGETVVVANAKADPRHFGDVDQNSGFRTRSILAVPLRARTISLGSERGVAPAKIIGGLEALNKIEGDFDAEDARMLEMLAIEAATVLEIATLYADANELFFDVVDSLTAAIDAKDPYTEGHSKRVSDYSVAIARELNLDAEFVHHVRIGAILHDVGKIGVPDHVLKNTSSLTAEEYELIKTHPTIGEKIMGQIRTLHYELPALVEHHERIDGSGYPRGLSGDDISLMGRIVAVADTFDAITSDRPYHAGATAEEAFARLRRAIGTHFDPQCVEALIRASEKGQIQTQNQQVATVPDGAELPVWFPPDLQLP